MTNETTKPVFLDDEQLTECLDYLDNLRESGVTNMFGARPYVQQEFPDLTKEQAGQVLTYWMRTFGTRKKENV